MVLALSSEVWKGCLSSEFKEGLAKELQLPDVTDATFSVLLPFLLPLAAVDSKLTEENVYDLTEVSVKYAMEGLKSSCVKHLSSVALSAANIEKRLYQAIRFQEDSETAFFRDDLAACVLDIRFCCELSFPLQFESHLNFPGSTHGRQDISLQELYERGVLQNHACRSLSHPGLVIWCPCIQAAPKQQGCHISVREC